MKNKLPTIPPMKNKTILVTGSTDGIGKQTALDLARTGATVILHGRSIDRCKAAQAEIQRLTGNADVQFVTADLALLADVRRLAETVKEKFPQLNVLINNAGVFMNERKLTMDGFEMTFAVNHLAPFLLTHLLLDVLKANAPARIVTVSSMAHQRGGVDFKNLQAEKRFDGYAAYSLSKLANVLFTVELAERLNGTSITANSLHPGVITTKLLAAGFNMSGASLAEGAETSVYLATSLEVDGVTGKYFVKKKISSPSPLSHDEKLLKEFWTVSEKLCGL
jgi:NAD(P)-dependent dehydrogenase (short-subunit alcohol dehydrogenase family)